MQLLFFPDAAYGSCKPLPERQLKEGATHFRIVHHHSTEEQARQPDFHGSDAGRWTLVLQRKEEVSARSRAA